MAPTDSMDVELPETKLVKIKADDDPESEGAFMRLSQCKNGRGFWRGIKIRVW